MTRNDNVYKVSVDMGRAELRPELIPVELKRELTILRTKTDTDIMPENVVNMPVTIGGQEYGITCVSMGNPHCVVFMNGIEKLNLEEIGPIFEHDEHFPERVNAEFVEIINERTIKFRVWERGSGETLACGTGACAAAVAAVLNGYCKNDGEIRVIAPGGELSVNYNESGVMLTGDAVLVYEGIVTI